MSKRETYIEGGRERARERQLNVWLVKSNSYLIMLRSVKSAKVES